VEIERSSGVLLHITSLPGRLGIGTLGAEAEEFASALKKAGFRYWQILPIGPVEGAFGFSPYASTSTFAGNILFISLEKMAGRPWFPEFFDRQKFEEAPMVRFEKVMEHRVGVLKTAAANFFRLATGKETADYERFCSESKAWLDDYALFSAVAGAYGTNNWLKWDARISMREPAAIKEWAEKLETEVRFHRFCQYVFFRQWDSFRRTCASNGVRIIGDIPIYINLESADAWANPGMLHLDRKNGRPVSVAGVPPDYFSETGQRWGNPLYVWEDDKGFLNEDTFKWWRGRISHLSGLFDIIRIDHFRGFAGYWSIPAEEKTAVNGEWIKGPGMEFFHRLKKELGDLPLIAEDLGVITPDVEELRDGLGLPGMKILQFAFDFNNKNYYLPHNITEQNCVLYTGTHDNNTTNGWFYGDEIDDAARRYVLEYIGADGFSDLHWKLIRQAYRTTARLVIVPAQDLLGYGKEFRMNTPGTIDGNWAWKLTAGAITDEIISKLRKMGEMYDRIREDKTVENDG
jgi:4-alpha-glucanotransferase